MVKSNKMKLSFTNLDRIYVAFISVMIKRHGDNNNNNNNNNNKNNNNNLPETRKYWVDVQRGIVSSHGERDPL